MTLDKISLTLYDFLGYLLPGFVLIFCLSLVEATFFHTSLVSLDAISANLLIFTIAAYFVGHASHAIGSLLKDRWAKLFSNYDVRLGAPIYRRVREAIKEAYGLSFQEGEKLNSLETYILADGYVISCGSSIERDVLLSREGFYKATTVSFAILTIVLLAGLFAGGSGIQAQAGQVTRVPWPGTLALGLLMAGLTIVFRNRFAFFSRIKINNTLLLFLALYGKECRKQ